jgi:tetratricopeptide (TPR) repeat protein
MPWSDTGIDGLQSIAFGASFKIEPVTLDYAYIPYGDLGNVQRLSLSYSFASPKPAPKPSLPPKPVFRATPSQPPALAPLAAIATASPSPSPIALPVQTARPTEVENDLEIVETVPDKDLDEARSLVAQGKIVPAINAYSQAIERSPEDAIAWQELADLYFQVGKPDFALLCYKEVVKLNPDSNALKAWIARTAAKFQ